MNWRKLKKGSYKSMSYRESRRSTVIVYIALSLLCFFFMLTSESKFFRVAKNIENTVFYPFRFIARFVGAEFASIGRVFNDKTNYKQKIEDLELQIKKYQADIAVLNATEQENERLNKLLDLRQNLEYSSIIANVVGRDYIYGSSFININKGSIDGVKIGLPVISLDSNGIKIAVGVVSDVNVFSSTIRTIYSSASKLGVYIPHIDNHSVIEGLGIGGKDLKLLYISKDLPINKDDFVYTSIDGSIFPPNILVGSVHSIDNTDKTAITYQIYVSPAVHINELSHVFVLKPKLEDRG